MLQRTDHLPCLLLAMSVVLTMAGIALSEEARQATFAQSQQPPMLQTAPLAAQPATPAQAVEQLPLLPIPPAPVQPPSVAKPPDESGLIGEFNNLLKKSADGLSSTWQWSLQGPQQTWDDLNARTRDATSNLTKLQSVVNGRSACLASANGAPDCEAASEKLCKSKGYKEGKSLDIETAEKCSTKVYISGRTGAPGECRVENYVTRAVCQ